jgi:5-oxoprolinase (ATP-hydrolysing)
LTRCQSSGDSSRGGDLKTYVDRGGTFTDLVVVDDDGSVRIRKIPSDRAVVGDLAEGELVFGTTVATNALLERKGARTGLVVTPGFADLAWIGDMTRPALFDPDEKRPPPLCERAWEGPPDDLSGVDAVAVVLLGSGRDGREEIATAERIRAAAPGVFVTTGHELSPGIGYLGRLETALVDAAVTPVLQAAITRDRIRPDWMAMRSDGSVCRAADLRAPDAILSGPAGGVLAVAAVAAQGGFRKAVGLDMGGTSTDVCRVEDGHGFFREGDAPVAGVRVRRPMLEVETIAAGGGSILWNDGRQLGVGPASAGADPGPQCYGRGGPPTITDAALAVGLVDPLAFDPPLDVSKVSLPGDPLAFLGIARESMAHAVRKIAAQRGVDLSDHALVAYGGAAGQHAAEVAARVGIRTVLVHPCASVLSAFGQALARREESASRPIWAPFPDALPQAFAALDALEAELPALGEVERTLELRHRGTDHALAVTVAAGVPPAQELLDAFRAEHRRRYGFDRPGQAVEIVDARVRARAPAPPMPRIHADPWGLGDRVVRGPELLRSPTTSVHVPQGWVARLQDGLLRLDHEASPPAKPASERTPEGVALWSSRFMAVAEQAGAVLQRLARSVNIRERLDFSCAVFDGDGHLVANAPHIPVHLGAMGETVRDLLRAVPDPEPGQAWLTNDPGAGGSHLPDLTVVTAVRHGDRRFFVASRGHHVDVGGTTPGSMPPRSSRIEDEGFVVRHVPLLENGALRDLRPLLTGCRQPDTVLADLEAQVASNAHAAGLLTELGPPDVIAAWMGHLQDVAAEAVSELVGSLRGEAHDILDGLPLHLRLEPTSEGLLVDLTGTGGPHAGNLNAPRAVVRAAVLYALRVLVHRPIPLNEGALRRVRIELPSPSLVDPPEGCAIAGGNVETSQRLVDLFLRAAGRRAASQGTMNNLTLGGQGWAFYETIGGGEGASAAGPGASARQVHMTNTRATDPEVLQERLPLRVVRFAIRRGSGGSGRNPGGDGIVRELEVREPATAALLATRRERGAPGLDGGGEGLPGRDAVRRGGVWSDWDGDPVELRPGDRVRIDTPGGGGFG